MTLIGFLFFDSKGKLNTYTYVSYKYISTFQAGNEPSILTLYTTHALNVLKAIYMPNILEINQFYILLKLL